MTRDLGALPVELCGLHADRWTAPFWEGARQHKLLVGRCSGCDRARMPPTPFCPACGPVDITWVESVGTATVHAFTIARQAFHPALRECVPYTIAVVELTDHRDVRLFTNIVGIGPESVSTGLMLIVHWDDVDEATTIPRFEPSER